MKSSLQNDKEVFNKFTVSDPLRKLRVFFDDLLGHPLWWVSFKINGSPQSFKTNLERSHQIWSDPRIKRVKTAHLIFEMLKQRSRELRPFFFRLKDKTVHFCMPLICENRVIGYLGLIFEGKEPSAQHLNLLALNVSIIFENAVKKEELERLSATIRPRAIALSTVHTVHRIINSTLNLDELVSRLAHLTAQVLRANRCEIYLIEALPNKKPILTCKALVGHSKHKNKNLVVLSADSLEQKVAKTAKIILRRSFICIPLIDEDVIGVVRVSQKKDRKEFTYFDQEILTTLAEEAVIAIKNAKLYEEQKRVTLDTIQSLASIMETKSPTRAPKKVFLKLAIQMAEDLKLSEEETQALHYATLLKDTAKIGIPTEILNKPTKLTGEEYKILRDHPIKGAKIVQSFESLKPVVPIILYSREKFDGSGYPKGLKGEKIPIGARILALINALEAILIGRPYRDRSSFQEALDEIKRNSGSQFDPRLVEIFLKITQSREFYTAFTHETKKIQAT